MASHRNSTGPTVPTISSQPLIRYTEIPAPLQLYIPAVGGNLSYQWRLNGWNWWPPNFPTFSIANTVPDHAGIWDFVVSNSVGSATSRPFIVGFVAHIKITGWGNLVGENVIHPNGNIYDQILLTRLGVTVIADPGKVTRVSYIDLSDDIVQVEFSGAGTLTLVIDSYPLDSIGNFAPAASPIKYNQPDVAYMKGRGGIVIVGADETTNVSVFAVGRKTAVNQALFKDNVTYDGMADIGYIAIGSATGEFGGVRTADVRYSGKMGLTGLYAPGVQFTGPVYIGDINASGVATGVIQLGSVADARITGGELAQDNGRPVQVSGLTELKFVAGQDANGNMLPAKANRAVLQQDGSDVTAQIVLNP